MKSTITQYADTNVETYLGTIVEDGLSFLPDDDGIKKLKSTIPQYADTKVETYLGTIVDEGLSFLPDDEGNKKLKAIVNTVKKDNGQEILLDGSPNPNFAGNNFNVSLDGMQMKFDLLENITKTLSFEANDSSITMHTGNLNIGSTLPNGDISINMQIDPEFTDIGVVLAYEEFEGGNDFPKSIEDGEGNLIENPAYIGPAPTDKRKPVDFKLAMFLIDLLFQEMQEVKELTQDNKPTILEIIWDWFSGIVTVGGLAYDLYQTAQIKGLIAGNALSEGINAGKGLTDSVSSKMESDMKKNTVEKVLQKIIEFVDERTQSLSIKYIGSSRRNLDVDLSGFYGGKYFIGFGDVISPWVNEQNTFHSIHFNKSAFINDIYTPDIHFGEFIFDTEDFNLFPQTQSLKAFKQDYDTFKLSYNTFMYSTTQSFTITINGYGNLQDSIYFYGSDRNGNYSDQPINISDHFNFEVGDTIIFDWSVMKTRTADSFDVQYLYYFKLFKNGQQVNFVYRGIGNISNTFTVSSDDSFELLTGYINPFQFGDEITFLSPTKTYNNFNITNVNRISDIFYTKLEVDAVLSSSAGNNISWNTISKQFDCSVVNTDVNVSDENLNLKLANKGGTNITWNAQNNQFDCSVVNTDANVSDDNLNLKLASKAGTNITWNTTNKQFDCSVVNTDANVSDANLNLKLANKGGNNISWNTDTNKFDVNLDGYIKNIDGTITIKSGDTPGSIKLNCENDIHFIELKAPLHSEFSGNISFTLPSKDGNANQVLKTDGSGNLGWIYQSSGGSSFFTESVDYQGDPKITYDNDIYCKNIYFGSPYKSLSSLSSDISFFLFSTSSLLSTITNNNLKQLNNRTLDISDNEILTFEHIPNGDSYQIKYKTRSLTSISHQDKIRQYAYTSTPPLNQFDIPYPPHIHTFTKEEIAGFNWSEGSKPQTTEIFESGELQTPENNSGGNTVSISYYILTGDIIKYTGPDDIWSLYYTDQQWGAYDDSLDALNLIQTFKNNDEYLHDSLKYNSKHLYLVRENDMSSRLWIMPKKADIYIDKIRT